MNILVICEKQNAAERIASILSGGTEKKKKEDKIEIYTFSKGKDSYTIIPLKGHIVKPDFPVKYNQWLRISPKRLIDIEPEITIDAKEYVKLLQKEGKKAERVIIATDYDREGELIGLEALELIKKVNKNIEVKRARFSAFTEKEVTSSFKKLGDIDKNLADSARSRQFIDLTWGAVLTRFLSMASYRLGEDFLSVGRVQSPTLSLIVKRDDEIEKFVPQPYWVISVELEGTEKGKPVQFKAKCKEEKFLKKKEAEEKFKRIKAAKEGKVVEAKVIIREDNVITPFNTTAFLTAAAELGFTPARAMEIAEFLYTSGYISYPRTDNTVYPDSMDFMEILKLLEKTEFKPLSKKIQAQDEIKPSKGKKESKDHPPIYPTGALKKGAVEEHEYKIYELIVRRFLATLSKPSKIKAVSLEIDLKKELVVAKGMQIVEKGWREFYPYIHVQEAHIPEMKKGEKVKKLGETLEEKYTKPPPRISLGGLIAEMERLQLGTKSTRHDIIQKLYSRGYINGRPPVPTLSGKAVSKALEAHARMINEPQMTAALEQDMDLIAAGEKTVEETVQESKKLLHNIVDIMQKERKAIGVAIRTALKEEGNLGPCTKCGTGTMYVMKSRKGKRFAGCSSYPKCNNSYPLPQTGKIFPEKMLCECGAPIIKVTRPKKRPWIVCINMNCPSKKLMEALNLAEKGKKEDEEPSTVESDDVQAGTEE